MITIFWLSHKIDKAKKKKKNQLQVRPISFTHSGISNFFYFALFASKK
jgi:hypothetical protein